MASVSKISGSLLLNLPEEVLDSIISYMNYDEISRLRIVCRKFNQCCQRLLNQGFLKVERYHSLCLRDIKTQLPRRESERRDHPLARHSDILTAIETRLSLLSMTFMKYVDMSLCCFIPGKVIDEIYQVLRNVQTAVTPPRSHEILQELRDISSMAMEHFDEHIVPLLKLKAGATRRTINLSSNGTSMSVISNVRASNVCVSSAYKRDMSKINAALKKLSSATSLIKKELVEVKHQNQELKKKSREQDKKISQQNQVIIEQGARLSEQDGKIGEISRKMLECDRHIADVTAELSRSRDDCMKELDEKKGEQEIIKVKTESIKLEIETNEKPSEDFTPNKKRRCLVKVEASASKRKKN